MPARLVHRRVIAWAANLPHTVIDDLGVPPTAGTIGDVRTVLLLERPIAKHFTGMEVRDPGTAAIRRQSPHVAALQHEVPYERQGDIAIQ
jgi:hypothetical protein